MDFPAMKRLLEFYVDDVVDTPIAVTLFNAGKDRMGIAVDAAFPDLPEAPLEGDAFAFDKQYHEAPVLYAAAQFKAYDSSIGEDQNFMNKFERLLREFQTNYQVPLMYKNDNYTFKYVVTGDSGVNQIVVDSEYYNTYGNVYVYVDNKPVSFSKYGQYINFEDVVSVGSTVVVVWEPTVYESQPWQRMW